MSPTVPSCRAAVFRVRSAVRRLAGIIKASGQESVVGKSVAGFLRLPSAYEASIICMSSGRSLSVRACGVSVTRGDFNGEEALLREIISIVGVRPVSRPLI